MGRIEDYEPAAGCSKHGPCEGCRLDELEDRMRTVQEGLSMALEELNDAERAVRGDSGNPGPGDTT